MASQLPFLAAASEKEAIQAALDQYNWAARSLRPNPSQSDLVKLYHADGRPYTETTQEMVGGTQEQPAYAWVERHVMFSTREPVGAVIRVKLGGYGGERHFRIESKGVNGRAVALPYGARRNPHQSDVGMYQDILAHLRALQWVYTTTHWTSSGPNSYGDHLLLQRLYEGLDKPIDALGERMVAYFGPQAVAPEVIHERVDQVLPGVMGLTRSPLDALHMLERRLQRAIRKAWKANQDSGDEMSLGIDDFLMGLANERDEAIYLLKQRLHGSGEAGRG